MMIYNVSSLGVADANRMVSYTELEVWIEARKSVNEIYVISKEFPKEEIYGPTNQMRRCAVSVPSNIAEGCGRKTSKDTQYFLHVSRGSLYELETQLYVSSDQKYISVATFTDVHERIQICKRLLNGFINYYKTIQ